MQAFKNYELIQCLFLSLEHAMIKKETWSPAEAVDMEVQQGSVQENGMCAQ